MQVSDSFGAPRNENADVRVSQSLEVASGLGVQAGRDAIVNVFDLKEWAGGKVLPARAIEPVADNTLFGRDAELAALDAAFDSPQHGTRAVVLYGRRAVQGLGRTALALQYAGQALNDGRYPGGAIYVDLSDQEPGKPVEASHALPVLLAFVGTEIAAIPVVPVGSVQQQLAMYRLRSSEYAKSQGRMLLILDGVSNRQQVELLRPAGNHHLLLVPRRQLEPEVGTVEVTIGPLDSDSCVELLSRSLRGRNPHFVGPANEYKLLRTGWIAAGLPKAIELVARHLVERPATDLPELVRDLADAIDAMPARAVGVSDALIDAARLICAYSPIGASVAPPADLAGRAAVTKWITDDWWAGRPARWELSGAAGTGKTSLLNALARQLRQTAGAAVILVSADELAKNLQLGTPEVYQNADIMPFCVATVQAIADDIARVLPAVAQNLYNLALIAKAPDEMLDGTLEYLTQAAGEGETAHRFAFLTDNIDDALLPDSCRRWLLQLATSLGCPVATSLKPTTSTWMHAAVRLQLSTLGVEQLERFATGPDGAPLLTSDQARRIVELTKGLPALVAVALEPIRSRPHNVDKLLDLYEEKSVEGGGVHAAHLFNARQAVDEISRARVGRAEQELDLFDLMVVLRTFDAELLTALLADHELDERAAEQLVEQLSDLRSVVVQLDNSGRYEVHSLLVSTRTATLTPRHSRRLHAHIEAVIFAMLDDYEPGDAYVEQQVGWTKFENPKWNALAVEWFYHAAMSQDTDISREMRVRMSLLYFRAMWWYGWFAPVYICEMVPTEAVRQTEGRSAADRAWARALAQVQSSYPHTWDKSGASPADWQSTAEGLRYLLRQIQLKPDAAEPDRATIELGFYLNAFLADCARFKPDSTTDTPQAYNDAARRLGRIVFDDEDDLWNFPWLDLFDAEAFIVAGDLQSAQARLKAVLEYEEEDNDLRTRFLIAASQIARKNADLVHAAVVGARGLLRGYVYNVVQEDANQAPSSYTRNLHEESLTQLTETLDRLRAADPAAYAQVAANIATYFKPYWSAAAAEQIAAEPERWTSEAAASFAPAELLARFAPQPPADADFGRKDSEFALRAGEIHSRMESEFEWPPEGWQPASDSRPRRVLRRLRQLLTFRRTQPAY